MTLLLADLNAQRALLCLDFGVVEVRTALHRAIVQWHSRRDTSFWRLATLFVRPGRRGCGRAKPSLVGPPARGTGTRLPCGRGAVADCSARRRPYCSRARGGAVTKQLGDRSDGVFPQLFAGLLQRPAAAALTRRLTDKHEDIRNISLVLSVLESVWQYAKAGMPSEHPHGKGGNRSGIARVW